MKSSLLSVMYSGIIKGLAAVWRNTWRDDFADGAGFMALAAAREPLNFRVCLWQRKGSLFLQSTQVDYKDTICGCVFYNCRIYVVLE